MLKLITRYLYVMLWMTFIMLHTLEGRLQGQHSEETLSLHAACNTHPGN